MNTPVVLCFVRPPSAGAYMLKAFWPGRRPAELRPALGARWSGHRVDQRRLAAFRRITGLPDTGELPLLYPHTFGFRLAMAVLTHPSFPVPIWGVLQTRNHLLQHRAIDPGERLDFELQVSAARVLDKGAEIDLHTTLHASGALAWESLVTFYTRGRFGGAGEASPLARAPSFEALEELDAWTLDDAGHWQLGAFTGDYNGIHLFDWYARRFGFESAIYHPPRVIGECLARLPALDARAPQRLDVWLKGPVAHGARVRLGTSTALGQTAFALHATAERPSIFGVLSRADAHATLIDDRGHPVLPHGRERGPETEEMSP